MPHNLRFLMVKLANFKVTRLNKFEVLTFESLKFSKVSNSLFNNKKMSKI